MCSGAKLHYVAPSGFVFVKLALEIYYFRIVTSNCFTCTIPTISWVGIHQMLPLLHTARQRSWSVWKNDDRLLTFVGDWRDDVPVLIPTEDTVSFPFGVFPVLRRENDAFRSVRRTTDDEYA